MTAEFEALRLSAWGLAVLLAWLLFYRWQDYRSFRLQYDLTSDRYFFYLGYDGGHYTPKALQTGPGLNQTRASQFTTRADSVGFWVRNGVNAAADWSFGLTVPYLKFS